eukprot:CAMPEP_0176010618 /NCGR_PEP_ID=MMETSP0120_2-20121206/4861_1 /TAXON_ID=160619 /ORGANISM="Kryptoperidinium foliaceum, Strain CCMP 1326" /LENGTH=427 /DNA_ID=CAMNT_0017343455 /DNA_START=56 /DNA_END=1335 /DNA_ORIENTATION=+
MSVAGAWLWDIPAVMSEQPDMEELFRPSMDPETAEVFWTVLRPGYLIALFTAGWALNIVVFGRFRVDYCTVLGIAKDEVVSPYRLLILAATICVAMSSYRVILSAEAPPVVALWSILLGYAAMLCGLFVWLPPTVARHVPWRAPLARALWRCICPDGGREVPFVEVLVADGLTSMAKVFFDLSLGACVAVSSLDHPFSTFSGGSFLDNMPAAQDIALGSNATSMVPAARSGLGAAMKQCRRQSVPFLFWALPFLIRARQCIVTSRHAPDTLSRDLQRVNLLKYLSALPVIFFSLCYAHSGSNMSWLIFMPDDFEAMWALSAVINSIFSFMWDLVMDWGLLQPGDKQQSNWGLRPVLLFRGVWGFYHICVVLNLVGRTLWSLRWSPQANLFLGTFFLASFQQVAEVLRRCLWNVLRVEWECIKKGVHR